MQLNNAMEIFKLTNKSNCRECNEKTCLAFASAVFMGKKQLNECPHLDAEMLQEKGIKVEKRKTIEDDQAEITKNLIKEVKAIDLAAAAKRVNGTYANGKLTVKIMGKDYSIDESGIMSSDIHVHPWVAIPILSYILNCNGQEVSGQWVPFRELKSGRTWHGLFRQRCELALKKVADAYPDLFEDMIHIFNGKQVENHYESDISLVLYPLPRLPLLICYWKPEDGLESDLTLFFDKTAEDICGIEAVYALGAGLVRMFEKISLRHGNQTA